MNIGDTILSAFMQVLFEQLLTGGGIQFLKLIGGVNLPKTIEKWQRQLAVLETLLEDAQLQQFHSKPVKLWLNDLRDLAYDIEDLLDHFATKALGYQLKKAEEDEANAAIDHSNAGILDTVAQTIRETHSRAADSLSNLLKPVDQDIRDKIDEITERLQDIQNQKQNLSLTAAQMMKHQTLHTETLRSRRESASFVGKVFGRDDNKKQIITQLLNDDQHAENYVVIPIVGTGGIGKTTLAQYVYNDEHVKDYFDLRAWVCISDVFNVKRVTIDIINSATKSDFNCSNLDQAQLKLLEMLNGKKFFIVLDDIWSEEYADWEQLQQPFLHGAKGSRVVITTRVGSIAAMTMVNNTQRNITKLESLSDDDSWRIFQQHANVDSDLAELRDNIIEKIDGLPLAAKALGGLLTSIPDKSRRRKILESNVWGEKSNALPVLRLSYYHMPSHLKRVFAYCSVFPKDYQFQKKELVLLWMAQGFLPKTQNERMEDIGHDYFNDLVSRSLFEKVESHYYEENFMMHDLIHDVAQLAAGDVCCVMDSKRDDLDRIRHLFITKHVQTLGNLNLAPQLRTFLCSNYDLIVDNLDIIQRMHYIRTLRLVSEQIEVLPECIGDLKHLRYLSLNFRRIKVLPQSISNLWNLHTLCLRGCLALEMIPQIRSLEKLRHMYITCREVSSEFIPFLMEMPLKEMPHGIGKLTNLQTLSRFVLATGDGSRIRELGMLNDLRERLVISGLQNVTQVADAEEAQLHKKECLDELHMEWGASADEVDDKTSGDVVEKLRPHTNINKCKLDGYKGSKFPSWLGDSSFNNMVEATLTTCHKCKCLPPLGQLPSLKSLLISNMDGIKEVGLEFYGHCSTPFPSLTALHISAMKSLEKWVYPPVDIKPFAILEKLVIYNCPSLQGDLPPHLPSLSSLTTLDIQECRQLQSLEFKNSSSSTSHLEKLNVGKCDSMVSICNIPLTLHSLKIQDCEKLEDVKFDEQSSMELPLFTELSIKGCPTLISLQQNLLFPALRILELRDCKIMESADSGLLRNLKSVKIEDVNIKRGIQEWGLHLLQSLEKLELNNVGKSVDSVECIEGLDLCLPSSSSSLEIYDHHSPVAMKLNSVDSVEGIMCPRLSLPSSLHELKIEGFQNLKTISIGSNLPSLTDLDVSDCPRFESLVSNVTSLKSLSIKHCPRFESLVSNFTALKSLSIRDCLKFHSKGGLPTILHRLSISETKIDKLLKEWGLHLLTSLKELELSNVGNCVDAVESIGYPDFPSSLCQLNIEGFQNLKTICCSTLPKLSYVCINNCPKLESFGDNALPPHIILVSIKECDMIEQHLTSDPNGLIETANGRFSLLLSGNQSSSAHSST